MEAFPKPSDDELNDYYHQKYFQKKSGNYSSFYSDDEIKYFQNIAKTAAYFAAQQAVDSSLLDLGCGEGFFSKYFKGLGWSVACCDFSEFAISKHNPELLGLFRRQNIFDALKQYQDENIKFGLINMQNILEHVPDPVSLLSQLRSVFNSSSIARIQVPNDYSSFQNVLIEKKLTEPTWFAPPEHLCYFNAENLRTTLERCNYQVLSIQATFPIEIFITNPHSNYAQNGSLGKGAHQARIFCENFLMNNNIGDYIKYSEAAASLGFGRQIIAYIRPSMAT